MSALRSAGFERNPVPAGRTDLGVHARMQVLSMRVPTAISTNDIAPRLNAALPPDVGIALARDAPNKFHAQWQSKGKEYRYHQGMPSKVEVRVEDKRFIVTLLPSLEKYIE